MKCLSRSGQFEIFIIGPLAREVEDKDLQLTSTGGETEESRHNHSASAIMDTKNTEKDGSGGEH